MENERNVLIGDYAGANAIKLKNCVFIGKDAGRDITEGENIVIIGNGIRDLNPENGKNVAYFGNKVAIDKDILEKITGFDLDKTLENNEIVYK